MNETREAYVKELKETYDEIVDILESNLFNTNFIDDTYPEWNEYRDNQGWKNSFPFVADRLIKMLQDSKKCTIEMGQQYQHKCLAYRFGSNGDKYGYTHNPDQMYHEIKLQEIKSKIKDWLVDKNDEENDKYKKLVIAHIADHIRETRFHCNFDRLKHLCEEIIKEYKWAEDIFPEVFEWMGFND